jgi:hypothetical protein
MAGMFLPLKNYFRIRGNRLNFESLKTNMFFFMKIYNLKYSGKAVLYVFCLFFFGSSTGCKINDELPPIITLNGNAAVEHPLNQIYKDAGATATDDTDGNVSANIYVQNNVNENFMGYYDVVYNVVDKAGNSAVPVIRTVEIINSARSHIGNYNAKEVQVFGQDTCSYDVYFDTDSTVNYRMVFTSFACEAGLNVYANLDDTLIIIPFQTIEDSVRKVSFQGAGYINDTLIFIEYKKNTALTTSYWNVVFNKQP